MNPSPTTPRTSLDDALHEAFTADILAFSAVGTDQFYALLDQGRCDKERIAVLIAEHRLPADNLFLGTPEAHSLEYGPLLLTLPRPLPRLLAATLAGDVAVAQALSLISSPCAADDLASHLRACLNGGMADGTSLLMRYYDPRTGFAACRTWPEAARSQFLAPLTAWFGWDREAQPQTLRPEGQRAPGETPAWPLDIDDKLLTRLGALNEVDSIIDQALTGPKAGAAPGETGISPWLAYPIVRDALAFVASCGNVAWNDLHQAGVYALRRHPHFYRNAHFTRQLAALPPTPGRIARLLETLPEEEMFLPGERDEALSVLSARLSGRLCARIPPACAPGPRGERS